MPTTLPDLDMVIASLLFQGLVDNKRCDVDEDGNPTIVISNSDVDSNRGYHAELTETDDGDIRITLKR